MKLSNWSIKALLVFLPLVLASCGGSGIGGGGSVATNQTGSLKVEVAPTTLTAGQVGTVTATYTTSVAVVNFWASDSSLIKFSSSSAVANVNGVATMQFSVGSVVNDTKVTIHAGVGSLDAYQEITIRGSSSSGKSLNVQLGNAKLALGGTTQITALLKGADGLPVSGAQVSFTTSLGTLNPAAGTATTDVNGVATIQLAGGNVPATGVVVATAAVGGSPLTSSATFSVGVANISLKLLTPSSVSILNGGSATISVSLLDGGGNPYLTPVDVYFTSSSATLGAQMNNPVRSANGIATSKYSVPFGISGTDTVTVSAAGVSVNVFITVAEAGAFNIEYLGSTGANIFTKGSNQPPELTSLFFRVTDSNGQIMRDKAVDFSFDVDASQVTALGLTLNPASSVTLSDGIVQTDVQGSVPSQFRVIARLHDSPTVFTKSETITISSGLPWWDNFTVSFSIDPSVPQDVSTDGSTIGILATALDKLLLPAPDGTRINFLASGGSIPSTCITTGGSCSVTWTSQAPLPASGRVAILGFVVGEESFMDTNFNGLADYSAPCTVINGSMSRCGEVLDTSEAFLDSNMNGTRDVGEPFIDFNGNGAWDGPDGIYNGLLRPASVTGPTKKHLFMNKAFTVKQTAKITISPNPIANPPGPPATLTITVTDLNGRQMPAGTNIVVSTTNGTITGPTTATVPGVNLDPTGTILSTVINTDGAPSGGGIVTVTVTSPNSTLTIGTATLTGNW